MGSYFKKAQQDPELAKIYADKISSSQAKPTEEKSAKAPESVSTYSSPRYSRPWHRYANGGRNSEFNKRLQAAAFRARFGSPAGRSYDSSGIGAGIGEVKYDWRMGMDETKPTPTPDGQMHISLPPMYGPGYSLTGRDAPPNDFVSARAQWARSSYGNRWGGTATTSQPTPPPAPSTVSQVLANVTAQAEQAAPQTAPTDGRTPGINPNAQRTPANWERMIVGLMTGDAKAGDATGAPPANLGASTAAGYFRPG